MDFIKLPLLCLETFDAKTIRKRLGKVGLGAVTSTVQTSNVDITSDDYEVHR